MGKTVQYTQKEILEMIPEGWYQITLDTYINKLMKLKVSESDDALEVMENNLKIATVFLDLDIKIVEQFPMTLIKNINDKLKFLSAKPKRMSNSKYNWVKNIEDPTYDDFITFIKVSEQIENKDLSNFPLIIKVVLKTKLTDEEIMKMPMDEVEHGFFLLRKYTLNYLKSTMKDLQVRVIAEKTNEIIDKMKAVEGMSFRKKLKIIRENYKELMAGTSLLKK